MQTQKTAGQAIHSEDAEQRREAARLLGSARTERKATSSRNNGLKGGAHAFTEETRAKMRAAQAARREREQQEKIAAGLATEPQEKRPPGRPRTRPLPDADTPKRPRGRPKKATPQMSLMDTETPETGA